MFTWLVIKLIHWIHCLICTDQVNWNFTYTARAKFQTLPKLTSNFVTFSSSEQPYFILQCFLLSSTVCSSLDFIFDPCISIHLFLHVCPQCEPLCGICRVKYIPYRKAIRRCYCNALQLRSSGVYSVLYIIFRGSSFLHISQCVSTMLSICAAYDTLFDKYCTTFDWITVQ